MSVNRPYRLRMRRGAADWDYICRTFTTLDRALKAAQSDAQHIAAYTRYRVEFKTVDRIVASGDIERDDEERAYLVPLTVESA